VSKQVTVIVPSVVPDVDLTTALAFTVVSGMKGGSVPGAGVAVVTGGVLSSLTVTETVVVSPAMFVAVQVKVVPAVSAVTVLLVQPDDETTLEPGDGSVTLQLTVTGEVLFQPAAFGAGLTAGTTTGGVLSILIPLTVATALTLPALSVHVPLADRPVPSELSVTGAVQLAMPERLSAPVNVTVTLVLFQPAALGAGEAVAVAVGSVLSILIVTDMEAESPAPSTAVHVKVIPAVSVVRVTGSQPLVRSVLTPEIGSVTVQFKVTLVLFHPAAFGPGLITGTIVGGLVSILTVTAPEADAPWLVVAVH